MSNSANRTIGSLDAPTTVICCKLINVAQGVVIHGVITTQESAYVMFEEIQFAI